MSKLFNTLEQIRRNESYQVSGSSGNSPSGNDDESKRKKVLFVLTLGVACFASIYFLWPLIMKPNGTAGNQQGTEKVTTGEVQGAPATIPTVLLPAGNPSELNDLAAQFIEKDEHWRGIYLLESITRKSPEIIEPFINLSVALAELGLFEPAKRYLKEAMRIDPENQALIDNLTVLKEAGVIDISFGPKLEKEKRAAGHSWFNSRISENDLLSGSVF